MNNKIFDLDKPFDFGSLDLANPTLLRNNSYFSKLNQGNLKKNLYIQLPKCLTKQGIVRGSNKTYCELNFSIADKKVIEFFENLEKYCIDEIYKNKELWFYDSEAINKEDIEDLFLPLIKNYKHGKNFLVKTFIKLDKINIYDENEEKLTLSEYNNEHYFIPLLTINGINFTSKNFSVEMILTQMMVIYPDDTFENQILIKSNKKGSEHVNEETNKNLTEDSSNNSIEETKEESNKEESNKELIEETKEELIVESEIIDISNNIESQELQNIDFSNNSELIEEVNLENTNIDALEENNENKENKENKENEENEENDISSTEVNKSKFNYLVNSELESVDNIILDNNEVSETFELKSRDEIYLEIYRKAKQKAKEIRKNAIQAFLEAKSIKSKYKLDALVNSDSSDDDIEEVDSNF